jgi:hypothetical protein
MDFTNREIAAYLWLGGVLTFMLVWKPDVRRSFIGVFRALAQPKLLILFSSATIYITLCVIFFASVGLWTQDNLKTTIVWVLSFVFVSLFETTRISSAVEEQTFFIKLARDTVAVTGVLTFIVELQSFSLMIELALFPLLTVVYLLHLVAERDPKFEPAKKLLSGILMVAGGWLFLSSLYMTLSDIPKVASLNTLREFGVPILLSLVFLPFLYAFLLLVTYENAFVRLQWQIPDEKLRQRATWEALFRFGPRLHLLRKWAANVAQSHPTNLGELRRSFNETIIATKREASPPFVKASEGWSPYRAKDFLKHHELATRDYHHSFGDEWFAGSSYLELGDGLPLRNNLAYYVAGTERAAISLKLCLNVNRPNERDMAEARFVEMGRTLLEASLGTAAAESAVHTLFALQPREIRIGARLVLLTHEQWDSGIPGGYSRSLEIRHEG